MELNKNKLQKTQNLELRLGVNKMKEFSNAMKELAIDVIFIVIVSCLVVFYVECI